MAHHIAELIAECDKADPDASKAAKEKCATAILELWSHRASLTGTSKPFQDLAPIIETLRALDPEAEQLFYRRMMPSAEVPGNEQATKWLGFARNCDAIARVLIGIGIEKASEHTVHAASEWANSASEAGLVDFDIQIVGLLEERLSENERANRRRIEDLKNRIEKLDAFSAMASGLRADLQKKLADLDYPVQLKSKKPE